MVKAIDKYRKDTKVLITYEELTDIPLQEFIEIDLDNPGNIVAIKINEDEKGQTLRVEMKPDTLWSTHYHDCVETILVYSGELYNRTIDKIINRYSPAVIRKYEDHKIEAVTDTVFYVEFINPLCTYK